MGGSMSVYGENEDQGKYWNEKPGRSWVVHDHEMNNRFQNISDILFASLDAPNLSNALDIGCGAGATRTLGQAHAHTHIVLCN